CAQALGFTLHVGDRDHGNAALLVRLPFAQIHLGISVTEEGPAPLLVELLLLEPQRLDEERATRVEVADAVPDHSFLHSISPGSSRNALRSSRNSAAGAPSTARWSHVSVAVMTFLATSSPATTSG